MSDVKIEVPGNETYIFTCKRWLDKKEDDGLIERVLYPNERLKSAAENPIRPRERSQESEILYYKVNVVTSDKSKAGTDAKVYIQIYGRNMKTEKMFLERSRNNRALFERGNSDLFELKLPDLGEIRKIRIGHDNSGDASNFNFSIYINVT